MDLTGYCACLQVQCSPEYYGRGCGVHCAANPRYYCDNDGRRHCHPGWTGPLCLTPHGSLSLFGLAVQSDTPNATLLCMIASSCPAVPQHVSSPQVFVVVVAAVVVAVAVAVAAVVAVVVAAVTTAASACGDLSMVALLFRYIHKRY